MGEITVEELILKRKKLERKLIACVETEINQFRQETGVSASYVGVVMNEVSAPVSIKHHVVTGVNVTLDI